MDRLVDAAVDLFAERGFSAVTVGEIEAAAGFTARGGTLYKHFASKQAVLGAAVERHIESLGDYDALTQLLPLPDLASELRVLARWMLARLDGEAAISQVLEKDGARIRGLVDRFREGLSDAGYQLAAVYLEGRGYRGEDADAIAVVLLGSLINLRRSRWTFGAPPNGIDDDRFVDAWVKTALSLLEPGAPNGSPADPHLR